MKIAGLVFLLGAGVAALLAFWPVGERGDTRARPSTIGAAEERADRFERELAQTQAELAQVRRELAVLQRALRPSLAPADIAAPPAAASAVDPETPAPSRAEPPADAEEAYLAFVTEAFDAELSDPRWSAAGELRPKLTAALPPGSVLRSLDCRTSLCRVETVHANHETYRAFTDHFAPTATRPALWSGAGYFQVTHAPERPGDELVAVAYLGRGSLPTAEPPR